MIRVLLADDHTVVRESVAAALRSSGECVIVAETGDGVSTIEAAMTVQPDVAIVDISMPRLSGMEVVRRLTADLPRTRVLVLTMHQDDDVVLQVVRAGAAGYLVKDVPIAELVEAVRTLAAGGVSFGSFAAKIIAGQIQHPQDMPEDPYGRLSAREREVLHLVAEGLTSKEIARRLSISLKTAENHRGRLLHKLGLHNSAELVRYAMRRRLVE
jgi:DNA-binding NarL/FixJ family response regulator